MLSVRHIFPVLVIPFLSGSGLSLLREAATASPAARPTGQ